MEQVNTRKIQNLSIIGIFLILFGAGLLLSKFHLLKYDWKTIFWISLAVASCISVVKSFIIKNRGMVFWGSLIFFISISKIVYRFVIGDYVFWDVFATISLALGFSFLVLFLFDPSRIGVLIPLLIFGGYGVLYYLWWWDVIEWFEVKYYLTTYWPVLIILLGLSLVFRPRK